MAQKDALQQDMFLLGAAGPLKRWLAMRFCEIHAREVEYVALSRDSTESDLKQRREIVAGGNAVFVDQGVVNAAVNGRVLILEGLEKVERNVLPVINNLLENREMALEDGRFLTSRTDTGHSALAAALVKVDPGFRVIALGVPVPPYPGNPLDPPLRSRFQGRRVDSVPIRHLPNKFEGTASWNDFVACVSSLSTLSAVQTPPSSDDNLPIRTIPPHSVPLVCEASVLSCATIARLFPRTSAADLLSRVLPLQHCVVDPDARSLIISALLLKEPVGTNVYSAASIAGSKSVPITIDRHKVIHFDDVTASVQGGSAPSLIEGVHGSILSAHHLLLSRMLQSHAAGSDLCLVGGCGSGKSFVSRLFARACGYTGRDYDVFFVTNDMTCVNMFNDVNRLLIDNLLPHPIQEPRFAATQNYSVQW
jgi:MoxR-like ATPase